MTYNIRVYIVSFSGHKTEVFMATGIEKEHLSAIIQYILPNYKPMAHEIVVWGNEEEKEAEE